MTQYTRILDHLRKAGSKGCTVRELMKYTNYPSARIAGMTSWSGCVRYQYGGDGFMWIDRTWRGVGRNKLRVYVLRRI